jgi:NAD(P)-dependent dehydrogenase (short-subunit alcohol dehydrogenase family)
MHATELIDLFAGTLSGRVGLVTGGGTGIGRASALALARAGADVAVLGRRPEPLVKVAATLREQGRRALDVTCDVIDPHAVTLAVERVENEIGSIDIAIAGAGTNAWNELQELTPESLRSALATNVEGVANLARAVIPGMRKRGDGKLIVIASDNGRRPEAEGSGYVASKFGAVGLALSLSQELLASGIGVHVIEPGCVDTDWYSPDEDAPRDRMLSSDDVALAVVFLATLPPEIVLEEMMLLPRSLLVEPW